MRVEYRIDRKKEGELIDRLIMEVKQNYPHAHAGNSLVLMVSPDYSATVAMHLAHGLSHDGKMCDLLAVDVPYPDQEVEPFKYRLKTQLQELIKGYKHFILVEAGVIRGSNYIWVTEALKNYWSECKIISTALFENIGSKFKSDVVAEYYNDTTHDLTFYYERENRHWK